MKIELMQYQAPRTFNFLRKLGKWFPFIWRFLIGVCDSCGKHVGFNSVISRHGFQCWPCNEKSNRAPSPREDGT
jgi:hypothetical protein